MDGRRTGRGSQDKIGSTMQMRPHGRVTRRVRGWTRTGRVSLGTTLPLLRPAPEEPDSQDGGGEAKSAGGTLPPQALEGRDMAPRSWGGMCHRGCRRRGQAPHQPAPPQGDDNTLLPGYQGGSTETRRSASGAGPGAEHRTMTVRHPPVPGAPSSSFQTSALSFFPPSLRRCTNPPLL